MVYNDSIRTKISHTLNCEHRVARNRHSWLLFTSDDRLYANLCVQEQSTNMTSQCQYPHSRDITDQLWWRHNAMRVRNKIIHSLQWITIFGSHVMRFANDCHEWLRHSWKLLENRLTRDPKIVIHCSHGLLLYIYIYIYQIQFEIKNESLHE